MDHRQFDSLLRRVSQQRGRRATIGALVGGALLLHDAARSDATKKAERRKKHKRNASASAAHLGVLIEIDHTAGTKDLTLEFGAVSPFDCCKPAGPVTIKAGTKYVAETGHSAGWVFINGRYWFTVYNPAGIKKVTVSMALDGRTLTHRSACCSWPNGQSVWDYLYLKEGQSRAINFGGALFGLRRNKDLRHHKYYTVTPPVGL